MDILEKINEIEKSFKRPIFQVKFKYYNGHAKEDYPSKEEWEENGKIVYGTIEFKDLAWQLVSKEVTMQLVDMKGLWLHTYTGASDIGYTVNCITGVVLVQR